MAEDGDDKTEAASPRKRQEAREQGQVARSSDLSASLVLLTAVLMLGWFGERIFTAMAQVMTESLSGPALADMNAGRVGPTAIRGLVVCGVAAAPLILGIMFAAVLANVVQVGLMASPERLMPKLDSLNPLKGAKRLFGGMSGAVQMAMNLTKLIIVGLVGYSAIHNKLEAITHIQQLGHMEAFHAATTLIYEVARRVALVLVIIAVLDYVWKRYKHEKDLRMTKQEVKDEMKRMEGDPMLKQRRRQIAMNMSRDRQKKAVPTADVVVTNPTEYAVAIKYDPNSGNAPRVVAKGRGLIAAEIRRIAIENGVPILERPPLARALHKMVDVGGEIPEELYSAVAEILAYVYELTGKLRRGRQLAEAS